MLFTVNDSMTSLLESLIKAGVITKKRVYDAMLKVDRKDFTQNPYVDHSQCIGYNVVISAPHIHGHALEFLEPFISPGCRILDVGSGTGYLTVALSKMMNDSGLVVGIEHIKELCELGKQNIMKSHSNLLNEKKIILVHGDGRKGYEQYAPYKCIHCGAAAETQIPQELIDQLDYGGRMVIPCGTGNNQYIYCIDKQLDGKLTYSQKHSVFFVPLTSPEIQLMGNNN